MRRESMMLPLLLMLALSAVMYQRELMAKARVRELESRLTEAEHVAALQIDIDMTVTKLFIQQDRINKDTQEKLKYLGAAHSPMPWSSTTAKYRHEHAVRMSGMSGKVGG